MVSVSLDKVYYTPSSKRILKHEQEHRNIHQALKTHKHTSELKTWDMLRTCHILTNIPCVLCGYATSKSPILTCKRTSTYIVGTSKSIEAYTKQVRLHSHEL